MPDKNIDHINGIKTDNRICNLRDISQRENTSNRDVHRNGHLCGTSLNKKKKRWQSRFRIGSRKIHVGSFSSQEEAHIAYILFKELYLRTI